MSYWFDWGDGTNSGWVGPYASGATVSATHSWTSQGSYQIKVKAKDTSDTESVWSDPLAVSMPKQKIQLNILLLKLISILQEILQKIKT